jgi:hypothetical protein
MTYFLHANWQIVAVSFVCYGLGWWLSRFPPAVSPVLWCGGVCVAASLARQAEGHQWTAVSSLWLGLAAGFFAIAALMVLHMQTSLGLFLLRLLSPSWLAFLVGAFLLTRYARLETGVLTLLMVSLLLAGIGFLFFVFGIIRLGWRRHGASPFDFQFLHLDWIFRPDTAAWRPHMANLFFLAIGMLLLFAAVGAAGISLRKAAMPVSPAPERVT